MRFLRTAGLLLWARSSSAQSAGIETVDVSGLVTSLAVVVVLIVACAWVLRRLPIGANARASGPLKLVATLPLGPRERLMLVTSRGREILIGVSPAGVAISPVGAGAIGQSEDGAQLDAERLAREFAENPGS